jgi:SAM-dependent methyltransferase
MHFYGTLAEWWPVLSPLEDYADEALEIRHVILERTPGARTLLELGSGGGHVAHLLAPHFECCLTDLSAEMLEVSRRLNPDCVHVQGDMRTLDLGRTFDVVLAHDAIDYITSEPDLHRVFDVAWRHLRAGGLLVLVPDAVEETFEPGESVSGGEAADGRAARLLEWVEAATPGTTQVAVHYGFLLRDRDGRVHSTYERHDTGLFPEATWTRALAARGFTVEVVLERTADARAPRRLFVGHKPAAEAGGGRVEGASGDAHR